MKTASLTSPTPPDRTASNRDVVNLTRVAGRHTVGRGGSDVLDDTILARFLEHDYARLVGAVALVCGDRGVAEDAVQEALVRAWERADHGRGPAVLGAWVRVVALNLVRSRWRGVLRERRLAHRVPQPPPDAEFSADALVVREALRELTAREREVVVLHYFLDLSVAQVAEELGVSGGTVKTLLHRARGRLAGVLGAALEVESRDV